MADVLLWGTSGQSGADVWLRDPTQAESGTARPPEDAFDHWSGDGWDHVAVVGSAQQSDAAAPDAPAQPDAPHQDETLDDDWASSLNAAPVVADVVAAQDAPADAWNHWSDDGVGLTAIPFVTFQDEPLPALTDEAPHFGDDDLDDPWFGALDASPVVADVVAADQPEAVPPIEDAVDDDWAAQLDAAPVGPDAVAAQVPGADDPWDHWAPDGWDHVAFPGSAQQSDGAAVEVDGQQDPLWPYDIDEFAPLYDWMVVGEGVIEEDPRPEEVTPLDEYLDDDWWALLDAAPVGADAAQPQEPSQPDAPHQDEIPDDEWPAILDAAPVGPDAALPQEPGQADAVQDEAVEDEWFVAIDASPVVADIVSAAQEEPPPVDESIDDDWASGLDASPVGADAVAPQEPGQPNPPHQEEVAEDEWWAGLDASPAGADVVVVLTSDGPIRIGNRAATNDKDRIGVTPAIDTPDRIGIRTPRGPTRRIG